MISSTATGLSPRLPCTAGLRRQIELRHTDPYWSGDVLSLDVLREPTDRGSVRMDVEKMRELADVIEANEPRFNMRHWASGQVNLMAKSWEDCGTSFCAAGWGAVLDGYRPATWSQLFPEDYPGDHGSSNAFYLPGPQGEYRPGAARSAGDIAQESLDLGVSEASRLFYAVELTTAAELRALVEDMIRENQLSARKVTL